MLCERIALSLLPNALEYVGAEAKGIEIMAKKGELFVFLLKDLSLPQLHILKQELLSAGGDLATPKTAILGKDLSYRALLIATKSQLEYVIQKCKIQPFNLKHLAKILTSHITKQQKISPCIMPIINLTPDSFYPDSRHTAKEAINTIQSLIEQGAQLIDIGAASSRPNSELVNAATEIERLKEVCHFIKTNNLAKHTKFSIDTYNAKTAAYALANGFCMVNDVSALGDKTMLDVVSDFGADFVLMHTKGTPKTMEQFTRYTHLLNEVEHFFEQKLALLQKHNVGEIILDIGFGFAKNTPQNLALVQNLAHFKHFGKRILVGASLKRTIGELTQNPQPESRLSGTISLHLLALHNGADIIRAHHFKEHNDMLNIYKALSLPTLSLENL